LLLPVQSSVGYRNTGDVAPPESYNDGESSPKHTSVHV
jgi:hypothetical protein